MAGTTRWLPIVNRLVDRMRATAGFRSPGEDADEDLALVFDGPEWEMPGDWSPAFLVIGGILEDEAADGDSGQTWGPIGNRARDEVGVIPCAAVAQLGGLVFDDEGTLASTVAQDTWRALGATAQAILDAVENNLRSDPAIGFTSADGYPRLLVEMGTGMRPRRYFTDRGAVVSITFNVHYSTRI